MSSLIFYFGFTLTFFCLVRATDIIWVDERRLPLWVYLALIPVGIIMMVLR